jgi:hypothetical protein
MDFPFFNEKGTLVGFKDVNSDITHEKIAYDNINLLNKELSDIDVLESKNEIMKKIGHVKKNGFITFKSIH